MIMGIEQLGRLTVYNDILANILANTAEITEIKFAYNIDLNRFMYSLDGGTTWKVPMPAGHYEPLTNGDLINPEFIFSNGDVVCAFVED